MEKNDLELMMEAMGTPPKSTPGGFLSDSGDCAFFYNEGVPYRRARVDGLLTVYRALDDDRIIGVQVKGIKDLPLHDTMGVAVFPKVNIVLLLLMTFRREKDDPAPESINTYLDAIECLRDLEPVELVH